jgi:murein DD-endopeptidase MepM/ murein hydrolase activator NlpD
MRTAIICIASLLSLTGCATVDNVKVAAARIAAAAKQHAEVVYQRQQKYLAEHEVLKTFADVGEHSETEVLKVLHATRAKSAGNAGSGSAKPNGAVAGAPAPMPSSDGSLRWPVEAGVISSDYGARWGKMHKGIDIAAEVGEPVYAVADGEVIYAGDGLRGYGNVVIIQHAQRISSLYAHNSELKVKQGDHVVQGGLIALMGSTGHSTGPHVHFELRSGDVAVNPHTLLPVSTLADTTQPAAKSVGLSARR